MAINGKKISSLKSLSELTGEEYLLVSYKGKSYKIPTQFLIGNVLRSIDQVRNEGDGADNPVTITTSNGSTTTFHIYNGLKGSQGPKGEKGDQGDPGETGIAIYDQQSDLIEQKIVNYLELNNYSEAELTELILSAAAGKELYTQVNKLKEVYLRSQDEYDALLNDGKIDNDTKYFIFEE